MHKFKVIFMVGLMVLLWPLSSYAMIFEHGTGRICERDCDVPDFDRIHTSLESIHDSIETKWNDVSSRIEKRVQETWSRQYPWNGWEFPEDRPPVEIGTKIDEICARLSEGLRGIRPDPWFPDDEFPDKLREILKRKIADLDRCNGDYPQVNSTPLVTPEPGSMFLLGSGLIALVSFRKK